MNGRSDRGITEGNHLMSILITQKIGDAVRLKQDVQEIMEAYSNDSMVMTFNNSIGRNCNE